MKLACGILSLMAGIGLLAIPALAVGAPSQPATAVDGDVVIALNAACTEDGWMSCAPFLHAITAFRTGAVFSDTSPGAVARTGPPSFSVGWDIKDNRGLPGVGVSNSVANWMQRDPPVHAQVGLSWSSLTMASAQLAHHTKHVMVGFSATSALLSSKSEYGYFMRTCPPDSLQSSALLALAEKFLVNQLIFVYMDEAYSGGIYNNFRSRASSSMQIYPEALLYQPDQLDASKWQGAFDRILTRDQRYIFASTGDARFWKLAQQTGILTVDRQWFGPDGLAANPSVDFSTLVGTIGMRPVSKGAMLGAWMNWTTSVPASSFPVEFTEGGWDRVTDAKLQKKLFHFYAPYHVDATFAILFAIERLHAAGNPLAECRGEKLKAEIYKSRFVGASGLVGFDENGDRAAAYELWNVIVPESGESAVQTRGLWTAEDGLVIGGWEGHLESPKYKLLVFNNGSAVPWPTMLPGCPKGQRYLSLEEGCVPCELGTYSPTDRNVAATCLPCEVGHHAPVEGLSVCSVCPAGTFQNTTGQALCDPCSPGMYAMAVGSQSCEMCSPGTSSSERATVCTACNEGLYAPFVGASSCSACPIGFTTEFAGSVSVEACACPADTLFVPALNPAALGGGPEGSCFRCNDNADHDKFNDGLVCPGGRMCNAIPNRTIIRSFPCPSVGAACVDPDACVSQCIVRVALARQVCESFEYGHQCEGWAVKSNAARHAELLTPDVKLGWQNVAILGVLSDDVAKATAYGLPAAEFSLTPKRSLCAPVVTGDVAASNLGHVKHSIGSYLQPPLVKVGYYMPDLNAARLALIPTSKDPRDSNGQVLAISTDALAALAIAEASSQTQMSQPWEADYFVLLPAAADDLSSPGVVPLFKCVVSAACSGGHPGQCFPGQTGLNCAKCVPGFYSSNGLCSQCTGGDLASWVLVIFVFGLLAVFVVLYNMTSHPLSAQLSAKLTTGLAIGLTFNGLQTFGVISLMNIEFGEPLLTILSSLRLLLFDVDQLQWECIMDVAPLHKLVVRILAPPLVCCGFSVLYLASRLLHTIWPHRVNAWRVPHTLNCTGMVLQVLFISICMGVIMPFKCAQHPVGGYSTLVDIGHQVCGVGDHHSMQVIGTTFVLLYPALGMTLCAYVIYILPRKTAEDPLFLNYCKFLVSRFRFDRYYFGILFMFRNIAIALVPVLNPNNPLLQQIVMACLLLTALCGQALLWPWAAAEVNFLDLSCLWCMIVTVVVSAGLVDSKTVDVEGMNLLAAVMVSIAFGLMAIVVLDAAVKIVADICVRRGKCLAVARRFDTSKRSSLQVEDLATGLENMVGTLGVWNKRHHVAFVRSLPAYDRDALHRVLAMMNGAIDIDTSTGGMRQSSRHLRITVNRFKRRSSLQATFPTIAGAAATNAHMEDDTCDVSV